RVDGVVRGDELHDPWNRVTRFGAGEVNRVVAAPAGRQLAVDGGPQVVREAHELEAGPRDGVRGDDSPAAGGGEGRPRGAARPGRRGRGGVAKAAAASNASSTVAGRVAPACRQMPSKMRSSEASAPVCEAAAR